MPATSGEIIAITPFLGGGAELAMMCDVVYASVDSVWGFPEIKLACYPPVASVALSLIGTRHTLGHIWVGTLPNARVGF